MRGHLKGISIVLAVVLYLVTVQTAQAQNLPRSRQKRVIGGTYLSRGDSPWLVLLRGTIVTRRLFGFIPIEHKHVYCGGSLLNDRWVLTAAHCFDGGPGLYHPSSWEVLLATVDLKVKFVDRFMDMLGEILNNEHWKLWQRDVNRIVKHPHYSEDDLWLNDIALLELDEPVPSGHTFRHIRKVQLPGKGNSSFPAVGQTCTMTGWGCTAAGGGVSPSAMTVELPIKDDSECQGLYRPDTMAGRLCAGFKSTTQTGGVCQGDSGGPLVCRNEKNDVIQVGVVSFTSKNNPERFPAVFTRVSNYVHWIKSHVENL